MENEALLNLLHEQHEEEDSHAQKKHPTAEEGDEDKYRHVSENPAEFDEYDADSLRQSMQVSFSVTHSRFINLSFRQYPKSNLASA